MTKNTPVKDLRLTARGLRKTYETSAAPFTALSDVEIDIHAGDFLAIVGKSGSGKSTLINLLTGLDTASAGSIWSSANGGTNVSDLDQEGLARWRGREIGVVFQFFQLLPSLTVLENTILPMDYCNSFPKSERHDRAMTLLDQLGIADHANKLPLNMSGGQQQRAAIARALVNEPGVIVADEPTGNLDSSTSRDVMDIFAEQCANGKAIVMVTHDAELSPYFSRTISLSDGRLSTSGAAA